MNTILNWKRDDSMYKSIITDQLSMNLEEALIIAKKYKYNYVEIHSLWGKTIEDLNKGEVTKAKKLLVKYNMKVSSVGSTIFFMCPLYENYKISNFNSKFLVSKGNFNQHLKKLKDVIEIAHILDAKIIRIFPFRAPNNKKLVGTDDDLDLIIEKLKVPTEIVEDTDLILALENCPHSYLPKGIMTKKVIDSIDSNNLKLLWDPANSFRAPINTLPNQYKNINLTDELKQIKNHIVHIHLKDYLKNPSEINEPSALNSPAQCCSISTKGFEHVSMGKGSIDYSDLLSKLSATGYDYALSLEPEVGYSDSLESMKYLTSLLEEIQNVKL